MAANKINLLFLFISLAPLFLLPPANAADVSSAWCGRTTHKPLCQSIVNADRRAALKTTPNGIATILRDKASATAAATSVKITNLLKTATDRHAIGSLQTCSAGYSTAVTSLRSANFRTISRGTYGLLVAAISDANDQPRDCELSFQEPPAIRSPISAENQALRDICATTLEIINLVVCSSPSFC